MEQRLIDSNELKTALVNYACYAEYYPVSRMLELIDQCPTVEPQKVCVANVTFDNAKLREIVDEAVKRFRDEYERPQGEWIPVTMRPIEEEEKIDFPDATFMFDCLMPEDGQQILISTKYGVEFDTCFADDGYYLDSDRDWEDVYAWQPLPEPYKEADMREGDEK